MEYMHELKDMLCEELEHIAKQGELTAGSLETIDKLTHSIKSIAAIEAMEDSGYSYDYRDNMYRGNSYARRRDSRGRYSRDYRRDGRYSRDAETDKMVEKLEKMKEKVTDQHARQALDEAIDAMEM